jgi:hypothetical protein
MDTNCDDRIADTEFFDYFLWGAQQFVQDSDTVQALVNKHMRRMGEKLAAFLSKTDKQVIQPAYAQRAPPAMPRTHTSTTGAWEDPAHPNTPNNSFPVMDAQLELVSVTEETAAAATALWAQLDRNQDGKVSIEDFEGRFRLGQEQEQDFRGKFAALLRQFDRDGNNSIETHEFIGYVQWCG